MTLKEFRDMYPGFKPHMQLKHKIVGFLEIISWPWEENNRILIFARKLNDPTTMKTYSVDEFLR